MSREVDVFLLPTHFEPDDLRGGIAVVIDTLRASTTIVAALANGAARVIPCGDVATARRIAGELPAGTALLGGERKGVRIDGFDLDNSPAAYTAERVEGKTIVFTTTNGTAALLRSQKADRVLIGSFVNGIAVVRVLAADERPAYLVCAGTVGAITAEDVLAAGSIAAEQEGRLSPRGDAALIAAEFWKAAYRSGEPLASVLRKSRGGRNLVALGLEADIDFAARLDSIPIVAEYFPNTADIRTVR